LGVDGAKGFSLDRFFWAEPAIGVGERPVERGIGSDVVDGVATGSCAAKLLAQEVIRMAATVTPDHARNTLIWRTDLCTAVIFSPTIDAMRSSWLR